MKIVVKRPILLKSKVHYPAAYISKEQFNRPLGVTSGQRTQTESANTGVFVEPKELFQAVYLYDQWPIMVNGAFEFDEAFFDRFDPDNPPKFYFLVDEPFVDGNYQMGLDWTGEAKEEEDHAYPYKMVTKRWIICPGGRNAAGEAVPFVYTYDLILNQWHALRFPPLDQATYLASCAIVPKLTGDIYSLQTEYNGNVITTNSREIETFMLVCGSGRGNSGEINTIQMYNTRLVDTDERTKSKQTALPLERFVEGKTLNFSSRPILTVPYILARINYYTFVAATIPTQFNTYVNALDNKYNTVYVGGTASSAIGSEGSSGAGVYRYIWSIDVAANNFDYSWATTYGSWSAIKVGYISTDTPNYQHRAGKMDNYMIQGLLGYTKANEGPYSDDYDYFTFGTEDTLEGYGMDNYGAPISYKVWYGNSTLSRMNQNDQITKELFRVHVYPDPKEGSVTKTFGCCTVQLDETSGLIIGGLVTRNFTNEKTGETTKRPVALSGIHLATMVNVSDNPNRQWIYIDNYLPPLPHPRWNASAVLVKGLRRFYTLDLYYKVVKGVDPTILDFAAWAKEIHGYDVTIKSFNDWLKDIIGMSDADIANLTDSQQETLLLQWRDYQNAIADWKDSHENEYKTYKEGKELQNKLIADEYRNQTLYGDIPGAAHQEAVGHDRLFIIGGQSENGFVPQVDVYRFDAADGTGEWETGLKAWKGLNEGELEEGGAYASGTTVINIGGNTTQGLTRDEVSEMIDAALGWRDT